MSAPDAQQWAASLVNLEATVVAVSDSVWDSVGFQPLPDPATVMSLAQLRAGRPPLPPTKEAGVLVNKNDYLAGFTSKMHFV